MEEIVLTHDKVLQLLPDRAADSHKGDYGRVLILAGSCGYTGAPCFVANGALRSGAGLVTLLVPNCVYPVVAGKMDEAMVKPVPSIQGKVASWSLHKIRRELNKTDVLVIGPGLGQSQGVQKVVLWLLKNFKGTIVLDADGINVLSGHMDILRCRTAPTILTPHPGEFQRIVGNLSEDAVQQAVAFAKEFGCILVLKGHRTIVTDGMQIYHNPTGNPGMAVGGSGDVLSGVIASLVGQGLTLMDAASCGVWIHGAAGDICAKEIGQYGMLPSDMLLAMPRLLK